mgnify:FL=1
MNNRIKALRGSFESENLDGYLVSNGISIRYFTGFLGGSRLLVAKDGIETLYVSMVNYEAAKEYVKDVDVELVKMDEDVDKKIIERIKQLRLRCFGFDSMDASVYLKFKESLESAEIKPMNSLVWSLRKVKDEEDLKFIKKAADLTSLGMKRAYEVIKPGLKEQELASEIEYTMRRNGSDGIAFNTIVASGVRSAFPHGGCSDRKIVKGDIVVVDVGAKYHDYCADLTRTFIIGQLSSKQKTLYNIVISAQESATEKIKADVKANIVDRAARDLISEKGYGEYFVHRLGHGIGLEVHEPPTLSPKSEETLKDGNVVTVEPGLYIPGFGGIRIEDTVLVKKEGREKLTEAPYTLHVI